MLGQTGEATVSFSYLDGHVADVVLIHGSGFPLLDEAALATVQRARYPNPPEEVAHKSLRLSVVVKFKAKDVL
jgi:protein TonB